MVQSLSSNTLQKRDTSRWRWRTWMFAVHHNAPRRFRINLIITTWTRLRILHMAMSLMFGTNTSSLSIISMRKQIKEPIDSMFAILEIAESGWNTTSTGWDYRNEEYRRNMLIPSAAPHIEKVIRDNQCFNSRECIQNEPNLINVQWDTWWLMQNAVIVKRDEKQIGTFSERLIE